MPGVMTHPPEKILGQLLRDLGLGSAVGGAGTWPVFVGSEPTNPDEAITVFGTVGRLQGRTNPDKEMSEMPGGQIRVRSGMYEIGSAKARAIADALDAVYRQIVIVVGVQYLIQHVGRTTPVLPIGTESATSKRQVFTVNVLMSLRQLPTPP